MTKLQPPDALLILRLATQVDALTKEVEQLKWDKDVQDCRVAMQADLIQDIINHLADDDDCYDEAILQ